MTLDTQMKLALLQELLMALRANDADGYKAWLALGIEELGSDVAGEVESDWKVPLLVEGSREHSGPSNLSGSYYQLDPGSR